MTPSRSHSMHGHEPRVPPDLRARVDEVVALTTAFAAEHLDDEYAALCRRMAIELARLRPPPIVRGAARTWAATITYAVGWVNFLADPSQVPHMSTRDLAARTGVGESTIALRFREVREALDLVRMDPAWTLPSRLQDNPLVWLIEVDGLVLDARHAPPWMQEEAFRAGAIPFLPPAGPGRGRRPDDAVLGGASPPPGGDPVDPMSEALMAAEALIAELLERNPGASEADLNAALESFAERWNAHPVAAFGGLSPDQVRRLLEADWRSPESAIRIADLLSLDELASSDLLHDARTVLSLLAEQGEVKATPKGNLPRAIVAAFRERMRPAERLDAAWYAEHPPRNEEELRALHLTRNLLEVAGLVKRRQGRFGRTRQGERLTAPERAGELFARLTVATFRKLNLAWLDGLPGVPEFQEAVGFTLHQLVRTDRTWRKAGDMVDALLLPDVRDAIPSLTYQDERDVAALMLETRFLRPLAWLGLVEVRVDERERGELLARPSYRRTPLLERAVVFDLGADGH